jgi:hypothetical protein
VRWIDLGHALPTLATAQSQTSETTLYGLSGGYAAFASDGGADSETNAPPTLVSTSSADGVNWTPATPIDLGSEKNEILIDQIAEGPAGLVAAGRYQPATCGGPETIAALWHSDDGIAWTPMAMSKEMTKGRVFTLDGGPAGYVATGVLRDGTTPGIWLTTDATTWRSLPLPKPPSGRLVVNDASSFAGGLAVGGAVIGPEGCGGASAIHPAVWASTDGTSWTRQTLPGASTGANASIQVRSLNEAEVVAVDTTGDTPKAWVSTDGRTWTSVGTPTDDALYNEVTDNRHVLSVSTPDSDQGPMKIEAIGDRLDGSTITQSGDVPMMTPDSFGLIPAVGPTGLVLMTTDGSRLWLGVPSGS